MEFQIGNYRPLSIVSLWSSVSNYLCFAPSQSFIAYDHQVASGIP